MAVLTVDDKDTQISYIDSGELNNETYVTLFLLHGHTFYSPIFTRIIALAPKYNIRIVAMTRRDYSGSTPFTPAELDVITHGDTPAKTEFLKARALELVTFLQRFTQDNKLPKASSDGTKGGIALLGWSLGNVQALSVVGLAKYLPQAQIDSLEPYFKKLVLYECPYHSLGFLPPPKAYHPLRDPSIAKADQNARFSAWVSGYFKHAGLASRDVSALEYVTPSQHRRATTETFSDEELAGVTDTAPGPRSEDPFFVGADPSLMGRIREDAFFPPSEEVVWPWLKIVSVWGVETTWSIPYAAWELEKYVQEEQAKEDGKWKRSLEIIPIEGANHFAHWDDPEKLMQVFADALSS